jgi:hypothetical protein
MDKVLPLAFIIRKSQKCVICIYFLKDFFALVIFLNSFNITINSILFDKNMQKVKTIRVILNIASETLIKLNIPKKKIKKQNQC